MKALRSTAPLRAAAAFGAWPLPALFAWVASWFCWAALRTLEAPSWMGFVLASAVGGAVAARAATPWRRVFVFAGFPLSFAVSGLADALPPWAWLLPLGLLLLAYPFKAWRDAPLFPTPHDALRGMAAAAPLDPGARVLDAGCGLGAGLSALRTEYPQARLCGIEWSWLLRIACAWRRRDAEVRRGDIWKASWAPYAMVYLFQRPESMERAAVKAGRELAPGAWLASLEFEIPSLLPQAVLGAVGRRRVWLYRAPLRLR